MKLAAFFALGASAAVSATLTNVDLHIDWQKVVDDVNKDPAQTWTATMPDDRVLSKMYDFDGFKPLPADYKLPRVQPPFPARSEPLPTDFDSRTKWAGCPSIRRIRDQCGCGSCFAFGAVEAFEDRICIHANKNVTLSVGDLITCHVEDANMSCQGGNPIAVWENIFFGKLAGDGAIQDSCYPYPITPCPCNHHSINSSLPHCPPEDEIPDPACDDGMKAACAAQGTFFSTEPQLIPSDNMEEEIFTNGPITAAFTVFSDFLTYSSGIYQLSPNATALGGHAIRIVGYGVENGVKYWTVANSWNAEWGENGYFRILRGVDECYIEDTVVAGLPA